MINKESRLNDNPQFPKADTRKTLKATGPAFYSLLESEEENKKKNKTGNSRHME